MTSPEPRMVQEPGLPLSIGQLGMVLLFASISVLFLASCLAVLITFHQAVIPPTPVRSGEVWIRATVPWGIAVTTGILLLTGGQLHAARRALARDEMVRCKRHLHRAGIAGLVFVLSQGVNCFELLTVPSPSPRNSLFQFAFNLLVGVHAVHVVGGLVYLMLCLRRLRGPQSLPTMAQPLRFCVQYWHYLAVVWFPLVATLFWVQ